MAGVPINSVSTWGSVRFLLNFECPDEISHGAVSVLLSTTDGLTLVDCSSYRDNDIEFSISEGELCIGLELEKLPLAAGSYILGVGLSVRGERWLCFDRISFDVSEADIYESGFPPKADKKLVAPDYHWTIASKIEN
jgi:hypothetical protein